VVHIPPTGVRVFLVESYVSNHTRHQFEALGASVHAAVTGRPGDARVLAVIQLPEENTLLSVVEAESAAVAQALASSAGVPGDRVVTAIAFIAGP
jgi:hypothetical protein